MHVNNEAGTIMPVDEVKQILMKKKMHPAGVPLRRGAELRKAAGSGMRGSDLGQRT